MTLVSWSCILLFLPRLKKNSLIKNNSHIIMLHFPPVIYNFIHVHPLYCGIAVDIRCLPWIEGQPTKGQKLPPATPDYSVRLLLKRKEDHFSFEPDDGVYDGITPLLIFPELPGPCILRDVFQLVQTFVKWHTVGTTSTSSSGPAAQRPLANSNAPSLSLPSWGTHCGRPEMDDPPGTQSIMSWLPLGSAVSAELHMSARGKVVLRPWWWGALH